MFSSTTLLSGVTHKSGFNTECQAEAMGWEEEEEMVDAKEPSLDQFGICSPSSWHPTTSLDPHLSGLIKTAPNA